MKYIIILLVVFSAIALKAQVSEQIVVPLSKPGEQGNLRIGMVRGNITVEGYSGKEVIIKATTGKSDCGDCHERKAPEGMKRISSSSLELSASENNNQVKVETNSHMRSIDLVIQLPKNFDLNISTVHGEISVSDISGALEVSTTHGPLTFSNISGSIVCNTVHGAIEATFQKVKANEPMSFVTLHGKVDVSFPSSVKATTKMKSDRGEIFTDFDMSVTKSKPEYKASTGNYKVSVNNWVYGDINGGGPEFTFKNMHGDIFIRSN